jgi:probable F420-dependent oxidoreductase
MVDMSLAEFRPFRFAVQATRAVSGAEWCDVARKVEDLGYSTLFLADHYLGKGPASLAGRVPVQHVGPIAAMATAAAVTTTLRVGCRVFCVDYHVPAVLVKEAMTIDMLSAGRLEFGIGAGWSEDEYRAIGLTFGAAPDRVTKMQEIVGLFKASATGEPVEVNGSFVTAQDYAALPRSVQRPHPPIMIGGGRRRVLTFAAREADIVSIGSVGFEPVNADGLTPHEEAIRRLGWVRDAAGDRFAGIDIESSPFFSAITDDPVASAERVAVTMEVTAEDVIDHPNVLIGTVSEMTERLVERRERFGINYVTIQQRELESFAPVVANLRGR